MVDDAQISDNHKLATDIKCWAKELGFAETGITDTDLSAAELGLQAYLNAGYHGSMRWLEDRAHMRTHPAELHPGTIRIISVRMNYAQADIKQSWDVINNEKLG